MHKFSKKYSILCAFLIVISVKVEAQPKYRSAKIEEPDVKQGGSSLDAISSRFHDLGGVISQLFSGFNQGRREGVPGLNSPTNSQFYPGVPAQNGYTRPLLGQGNNWPFPNQENIQGNNNDKGIRHQQLDQSNQNMLNSNNNLNPPQHHGWTQPGHYGHNSNYQSNPEEESIPNQGSQYTGQSKNTPWYSHGRMGNNGRNEGTLEDFFPTEGPTAFEDQYGDNDHRIIFPDHYSVDIETTSKNAIWGKQVRVPTTTESNNILFIDSSETTDQKQCVQNCPTSSEYNPVCGTDGVTYFNPGRLICARNCGINVFESRQGQCRG